MAGNGFSYKNVMILEQMVQDRCVGKSDALLHTYNLMLHCSNSLCKVSIQALAYTRTGNGY
jgi:hypothetical protein